MSEGQMGEAIVLVHNGLISSVVFRVKVPALAYFRAANFN